MHSHYNIQLTVSDLCGHSGISKGLNHLSVHIVGAEYSLIRRNPMLTQWGSTSKNIVFFLNPYGYLSRGEPHCTHGSYLLMPYHQDYYLIVPIQLLVMLH